MSSRAQAARAGILNGINYAAPNEVRLDDVRRARVSKDRRHMIRISSLILLAIFILIGMRAYCASIQHENNELIKENNYLEAEIDSLNSQLIEQINVTSIEKVATSDYGMVFPTSENVIVLGKSEKQDQSLAAVIRSEAYN
ncbi:MAG: hypothetical protein IKE52_06310 [Mogibacterium sp.]|nr:hypothetical protein [Mogibacterium sp.]